MHKGLKRQLLNCCKADIEHFGVFGDVIDTPGGQLVYRDSGSSILGVAHLDTVGRTPVRLSGSTVECMQLDDRLGAWSLLYALPYLGCPAFDLLLTEGEESGNSTAQHFLSDKEYNWVFEFDRAGTDVVMYEYETPEHRDLLTRHGFKVGKGSFTDICYLGQLGVKGFNFGVGYHNQHTAACHANLNDTLDMLHRFCAFAKAERSTKMPHESRDDADLWSSNLQDWNEYNYRYCSHDDWRYSYAEACVYCRTDLEPDWRYCPMCGEIVR